MLRFTLVLLLVHISLTLDAQVDFRDGYIIKHNGDSIPGLVAYPTINKGGSTCYYKSGKNSKTEKFSPNALLAYGIYDDKRFESKTVSKNGVNAIVFLEVLIKGDLSLYTDNHIFYCELDSILELPTTTYVEILNRIMSDCNLKADNSKYKQIDLTNLIQNYNRCQGKAGLAFKKNLPPTKFSYQFYGGVTSSTLEMENSGNVNFNKSIGWIMGASADISLPRVSERLFYGIEISYFNSLYQGYGESTQSTSVRNDVIINMSLLRIPIGVRYNFFSDFNSPFVKGGFAKAINVGSTYKVITETENNGTVTTSFIDSELDYKSRIGLWIGAGYQRAILHRYKVFIETRFEKMPGDFNNQFKTPIKNSNLNVSVGLRY